MKDIYLDYNDKNIHRKIKRYKRSKKIIHLKIDKLDIIDDSILQKKDFDINQKFLILMIHAVNIKNKRERITYLYDKTCEYLDDDIRKNNYCDFKCGQCKQIRYFKIKENNTYGCCYGKTRGICKHLSNHKCMTKNISCKLFFCRYLEKQGYCYKIKKIPLLKYFFNYRQKKILEYSFFITREEFIEKLIKH